MSGTYPDFQSSYTHEEMVEHFLLTPADLSLVFACRGHVNRCGMALLLKTLPYLGYVPESLDRIPPEVHTFVAAQLGLLLGPLQATLDRSAGHHSEIPTHALRELPRDGAN
jgi:hypothetical protein